MSRQRSSLSPNDLEQKSGNESCCRFCGEKGHNTTNCIQWNTLHAGICKDDNETRVSSKVRVFCTNANLPVNVNDFVDSLRQSLRSGGNDLRPLSSEALPVNDPLFTIPSRVREQEQNELQGNYFNDSTSTTTAPKMKVICVSKKKSRNRNLP